MRHSFAYGILKVYETSLFVAVVFDSSRHVSALAPHMLAVYIDNVHSSFSKQAAVLVSLLHHLVTSPTTFCQHLRRKASSIILSSSPEYGWLLSLATALQLRNYSRLAFLTRSESWSPFVQGIGHSKQPSDPPKTGHPNVAYGAVEMMVNKIRLKSRESSWPVLRSAYRELVCQPGSSTIPWLVRSLKLSDGCQDSRAGVTVADWLRSKASLGQVRQKEGVEGRWIVSKER